MIAIPNKTNAHRTSTPNAVECCETPAGSKHKQAKMGGRAPPSTNSKQLLGAKYGTQQNRKKTFRGARFGFDTAFVGTIDAKMGGSRPPINQFKKNVGSKIRLATRFGDKASGTTTRQHIYGDASGTTTCQKHMERPQPIHYRANSGATPTN